MDILSYVLGYNKGKAQGGGGSGEDADAILDEVELYLDAINGRDVTAKTIRFYDGDKLVHTEQVAYGGSSDYIYTKDDYIFMGWSPEPTNVVTDINCYAQWIAGVDFATASWAKISELSRMGVAEQTFKLGDTRKETLTYSDGTTEEIELQIVAFGRDTTEDGTPTMTLVPKNLLSTLYKDTWTSISNYLTPYTMSNVKTYLEGTVLPALPSALQSVLQTACPTAYSEDDHSVVTSRGRISLLDYLEIGLDYRDGSYKNAASPDNCIYGFSNTDAARLRTTVGGTAVSWWELSLAHAGVTYDKAFISRDGSIKWWSMKSLNGRPDMSILFKICV